MSFAIRFKDPDEERAFGDDATGGREGRITIGGLTESFFAETSVWSESDYEKSWVDNLVELRERRDAYFLTGVSVGDEAKCFLCGLPFIWMAPSTSRRSSFFDQSQRIVSGSISWWR